MMVDAYTYYLHPSKLFIPREGTLVTTILGSCISVCIHDKQNKIGGINHFMLPKWDGFREVSYMYGDYSIECLIKKMVARGSSKENLVAKLFGGSNKANAINSIGQQNISQAQETLSKHGIKVVAKNVGGERARKIIFYSETGIVKMKYIDYNPNIV